MAWPYISDANVDMLLPQIAHDRKENCRRLWLRPEVLRAKRKIDSESEDNRVSCLETVVFRYVLIRANDLLDQWTILTCTSRMLHLDVAASADEKAKFMHLSRRGTRAIVGLSASLKYRSFTGVDRIDSSADFRTTTDLHRHLVADAHHQLLWDAFPAAQGLRIAFVSKTKRGYGVSSKATPLPPAPPVMAVP